jgi:hypothetical protein
MNADKASLIGGGRCRAFGPIMVSGSAFCGWKNHHSIGIRVGLPIPQYFRKIRPNLLPNGLGISNSRHIMNPEMFRG